jgi:hypothetical protein
MQLAIVFQLHLDGNITFNDLYVANKFSPPYRFP